MKRTVKTQQEKEAIISEYLLGQSTYRQLAKRHNVDFRIIHSWVKKFTGKNVKTSNPEKKVQISQSDGQLPTDVKALQEELRKVKLHNELLNTMIDIAEEQLKIDIRKKSGTRR